MDNVGKLYLVSTPIGNLEDITLRALNVLKSVDLIAAEDTRHTRQLLSHFDIHTKLVSFHAFNEHRKTEGLIAQILGGLNVASVSDAGTPSIADPGFFLVREAVRSGIVPEVIPGVSALTFAATASALPVDKFAFFGFPPVKSGRRRKFFEEIREEGRTVFFFESPHRIAKTLPELAEIVGGDAQVAVIREATKLHEEILRGSAAELAALAAGRQWRGEFVIGVHPAGMKNPEEREYE
ncbi:16S rRNA (cytidine(1402)-2'-O)-methyltransferase [uncultured Victivallis sp.]|uniref:16S rRNA (cytidine(1402)-2'-O)-methyltransferase n=1 Tax=uncultured Victivallis sp. TaxID=354118 RepID=UPI0025E62BD6|nr:16S rRNA (cytidine(1402)-2'-O)-methyltransferase [uncultured Victivallis sp.]